MLKKEINKIKFLFKLVISDLELADSEDFTENFENARVRMILVQRMKDNLIKNFPIEELKKYDVDLLPLAKQIHEIYDNIIEKKRKKLKAVVGQMSQLQNRQKLLNYNR
jgi:hypothetical protein